MRFVVQIRDMLTEKAIEEILTYLENSMVNLYRGLSTNSEFQSEYQEFEKFLSDQFDIRLENLLQAKNSSIHHLESGTKNRIIQKKKQVLDKIKDQQKG
jgi:predicted PilT family ATPase